jgi:hypothetical protein
MIGTDLARCIVVYGSDNQFQLFFQRLRARPKYSCKQVWYGLWHFEQQPISKLELAYWPNSFVYRSIDQTVRSSGVKLIEMGRSSQFCFSKRVSTAPSCI